MTTTYLVNWRAGKEAAAAGLLEVTSDAVVFTPADGSVTAEVPFTDVPAVRRSASTVLLERLSGDPIRIESVAAGVLGASLEAVVERTEMLSTLREEHDRIDAELRELRAAVGCRLDLTDVGDYEVRMLAADLMRSIVHHAHVEEQELFPLIQQMLGRGPLVAAMIFDHRAIEGEACELARIEPGDRARFVRVFDRIDALVTTHIAKEEAIVFPLLESR